MKFDVDYQSRLTFPRNRMYQHMQEMKINPGAHFKNSIRSFRLKRQIISYLEATKLDLNQPCPFRALILLEMCLKVGDLAIISWDSV